MKTALAAAVTALLGMLALPIAITMMALPGQGTQQFFATCTAALGIRGAIVANPPAGAPSAQEVLLKIDQTAETLGFGRQGATVTVAIAMRATGLANAANADNADTQRYAHSAVLEDDGAGALGLPLSWGSAAELMTPEVSTALALDHMVNTEPRWRDTDPSQLAAQITGLTADAFTQYVADAQARLEALPPQAETSSAAAATALTSAAPTTTQQTAQPTTPTTTAQSPTPTTVLNADQASSAMSTAPAAANCLHALTTPLPAAAPGHNPAGPDIAAAAQHSVGTDQTTTTTQAPTNEPNPAQPTATPTHSTDSAEFVASILSSTLGTTIPTTIAEQLQIGYRVVADPEPGDAVYIDISADAGPHLAGIAVDTDTMVTVLPGHSTPEWTRIGPNRLIRRIEGGPQA
ncbi:hypothetical protein [Mycobacteroides abscessus]|uniref:hypothetical protein n=1 Tax=Mycobacteroides abscessus TaxID=36809 RepID=UPI001F3299F2